MARSPGAALDSSRPYTAVSLPDSSFSRFSGIITAADLLPIYRPHPRPWQRVPVPAASKALGLHRVWKRVGCIPLSGEDVRYLRGAVELRADGQGPRKSRRGSQYVPAWGDAAWKDVDTVPVDASDVPEAESRSPLPASSTATVPRKRNSRRQPLPPSTPTSAIATAPAPMSRSAASLPLDADAEQITRRAKRRLSRRLSAPLQINAMPSHKLASLPTFSSPAKRRRSFSAIGEKSAVPSGPVTTIVTPTLFKPVLVSPSEEAPAYFTKSSPFADDSQDIRPSSLVVFDQPVAEVEVESPSETRRRDSLRLLHNARRRETWSAAAVCKSPGHRSTQRSSRRHSALPTWSRLSISPKNQAKASSRRHTFEPGTLDVFPLPANESIPNLANILFPAVVVSTDGCDDTTTSSLPMQDETVVVDVRTNLDIFGSGPPVQMSHAPDTRRVSFGTETECDQLLQPDCQPFTTMPLPLEVAQKNSSPTPAADAKCVASITLLDDSTLGFSNASTPSSSPEPDVSTDVSRDVTDEQRLVSSFSSRGGVDESLLLPLPDTLDAIDSTDCNENTEESPEPAHDHWQSPTMAELSHSIDQFDTPIAPQPVDISIPPTSPVHHTPNIHSPSQVDSTELTASEPLEKGGSIVINTVEEAASPKDNDDEVWPSGVEDPDVDEVVDEERNDDDNSNDDIDGNADGDTFSTLSLNTTEHQGSPFSPTPSVDNEIVEYTVTAPIHMLPNVDDDITATMTMDVDNMAQEQPSLNEDSETEMLRKFVTRVKADKSAKAAAAASAAVASLQSRANLRRKRRSGSTGSTASASGSPVAKKESIFLSPLPLENRTPLSKKDLNMSPSPRKRRTELGGAINMLSSEQRSRDRLGKPALEDTSPPRPKRRRKKMEADTGGIFNPEFIAKSKDTAASDEASGPRRSKRTRNGQTPLKPIATAAATASATTNGVLSLIPVRLPGSLNLNGDDGYGLSTNNLSFRRNDEKDLAMVTRVNTRKNKGKAEHPSIVVEKMVNKCGRGSKDKKSGFDSPLSAQSTPEEDEEVKSRLKTKTEKTSKPAKSVQWAEVLARFQDSGTETSEKDATAVTSGSLFPGLKGCDSTPNVEAVDALVAKSTRAIKPVKEADQTAYTGPEACITVVPEQSTGGGSQPATGDIVAPETQAATAATAAPTAATEPEKKTIPRRTTRLSRLQPPTPREVIASAAAKASAMPTPLAAVSSTSTNSDINTAMGLKGSHAVPARRMATRRAKIVGMGMAGNGTPAPKRYTTRTT